MVVGKFKPKASRVASLKASLAIGLDEALTALAECIHDLTDEQAWARPCPGRHCIATIMMHMQHNIDIHACQYQTGRRALDHEDRFDVWSKPEPDLAVRQQDLPSVREMLERLRTLREAATAGLEQATEEDLLGPRAAADTQWWKQHGRTSADAYARVTWHAMAHVRQVWLLRGAMDLTDKHGWPQQHYH